MADEIKTEPPSQTPAIEVKQPVENGSASGSATSVPPEIMLPAIAEGALAPPAPLTSEQRGLIFKTDWMSTGNMLRLSLMQRTHNPLLIQEMKTADFSTPEEAASFVRQHPELPQEVVQDIESLVAPRGFDPSIRRNDFLTFAEKHGVITGRTIERTMNDGLQQQLESLQPLINQLSVTNPSEARKLTEVISTYTAITGSGVVEPAHIEQLFSQLPAFFSVDEVSGMTKRLAGKDFQHALDTLSSVRPLITSYTQALSGHIDETTLKIPPQQLHEAISSITQVLGTAQNAVASAENSVGKIKTAALLSAAALALLILNGWQGMEGA